MSSKVPRSSEPVKKGISSFDHRRRREDKAIALRREQREEGIEKRRRTPPNDPSTLIVSEKNGQCPDNVVDIANLNTYCECKCSFLLQCCRIDNSMWLLLTIARHLKATFSDYSRTRLADCVSA